MLNFLVLPLATIPTVRKHTYIYIYIIVKEEHEHKAKVLFADTNAHVTINGKSHLGAALGAKSFTEEYVSSKVTKWTKEIIQLSMIPLLNPHAAYAAFTHGFSSHWLYTCRTIPDIQHLLLPWETAIHKICWPSLSDWVEWGWLTPCLTQPMPLKDQSVLLHPCCADNLTGSPPDRAVQQPSKREEPCEEAEKGDTK